VIPILVLCGILIYWKRKRAAFIRELKEIIQNDRYPAHPNAGGILAKLRRAAPNFPCDVRYSGV
jgi:hypothetical protein